MHLISWLLAKIKVRQIPIYLFNFLYIHNSYYIIHINNNVYRGKIKSSDYKSFQINVFVDT